jgi:hypothetical protein
MRTRVRSGPDADDALLVTAGEIIESPVANVAVPS